MFRSALRPIFVPRFFHAQRPAFAKQPQQYQYFQGRQSRNWIQDRRVWLTAGSLFTIYYVSHLETVPMSNRRRFMSVTLQEEEAMAKMAYNDILTQFRGRFLAPYHPVCIAAVMSVDND